MPGGPTGGAVGAPCQNGADCASELCLQDVQLQRTYCTQQCVASQPGACPGDFVCEMAGDGNSYCLAPIPVDELCDQCATGEQCASGLCVTVANVNNLQPFCSRACDPTPGQPQNCPNGYQCVVSQVASTLVGACVPNTGICDPQGKGGQNELCFANGSCKPGHRCVEYSAGSGLFFCYAECPATLAGQNCGLPRTSCEPIRGLMNTAACFTFATIGEPCIPEVCDNRSFCAWDETVGSTRRFVISSARTAKTNARPTRSARPSRVYRPSAFPTKASSAMGTCAGATPSVSREPVVPSGAPTCVRGFVSRAIRAAARQACVATPPREKPRVFVGRKKFRIPPPIPATSRAWPTARATEPISVTTTVDAIRSAVAVRVPALRPMVGRPSVRGRV